MTYTTMSSVEHLRGFVNERLTAAAEEIFGVFKKTAVEYEEEIDRLRKLLEVVLKPAVKLHRLDLSQQHACKEEEAPPTDQERNSSLDPEDPDPPQIKEELSTSQEGQQLVLKPAADAFILTPTHEENADSEDQTLLLNPDETVSAAQTESVFNMPVIISVVSEANSELQLQSDNSDEAESRGQTRDKHEDSESAGGSKEKRNRRNTLRKKKPFKCDTCGKYFKTCSIYEEHLRIHTGGERPYVCQTCGKRFSNKNTLNNHRRVHTCERPVCQTCGKTLSSLKALKVHRRTHIGEKLFVCKFCGNEFREISNFTVHLRSVHSVHWFDLY